MRPVKRDGLQHVLCQLELLRINGVVPLIQKEIVVLPLLLLLLTKGLKVLLTLLHAHEVEGRRHLFRNLGALYLTHSLPHLLLVRILNTDNLVCRRYLALAHLVVRVFHLY